ncbi:MAG: DUF167 domain-containing protein [Bacteroidetes bacterium]|nr:MAG: DUF167 domain-containing protein [Bacteroidota bacterium]
MEIKLIQTGSAFLFIMKITVHVKPNARKNEVVKINDTEFQVKVAVPPIEGKANERVIELLSEYFHKPKREITIVLGKGSKNKVVAIS